jgi:hypothetical protein
MGKYCSWPELTDITHSSLLFINGQEWDFVKLSCPANLGSDPDLPRSIPLKWQYKKRLVSSINPSLLLKITLYTTWTLQFNNINQMKLYTKDY